MRGDRSPERKDLPSSPRGGEPERRASKKILQAVQEETRQEIERLITQALHEQERRRGRLDLEALEMGVRRSMHEVGGHLVERLLNTDPGGYQGARVPCSEGHEAAFVAYRGKTVVTVLD